MLIFFPGHGVLKSDKIVTVMKQVDRGDFSHVHPYMDAPQGIGYGVTISAPHMVKTK
jgi:protein-L-isoaspartate(D-aspartate) O-methyltransferase